MPQVLHVLPSRFINAEPALLPFEGGPTPVPVVLLSFGGEEGPVVDKVINVVEARQMVVDILDSLATMGDPLAQAIGAQFFSGQGDGDVGDEPEFDTGSEYEDECPGCG